MVMQKYAIDILNVDVDDIIIDSKLRFFFCLEFSNSAISWRFREGTPL